MAVILWMAALHLVAAIRVDEDDAVPASSHERRAYAAPARAAMVDPRAGSNQAAAAGQSRKSLVETAVKEDLEKAHAGTTIEDTPALGQMLIVMAGMALLMVCCALLAYKCLQQPDKGSDSGDMEAWRPDKLYVTDTTLYDGTYHIVPGASPNGMPLWKQEGQPNWIFAGEGNQWFIGDEDEEAQAFFCNTGNVASFEEHAGRMPDEIGPGGWLYFKGTEWVNAPAINITSDVFTLKDQEATVLHRHGREVAATKIQSRYRGMSLRRRSSTGSGMLQGPSSATRVWPASLLVSGAKIYSGSYHLVPSSCINNFPIWKRQGTQDWIFCGEGGQWLMGDEDEEKQGFRCNTGNIASSEENGGRLPNELEPGGWLYFDGMNWVSDPNIHIE
jgi:hypothetical protein